MSGDGGKDIRAEGLDLIAQGITLTLGELKEIGIDYVAGTGRGFENIALNGLALGHEGLTAAFKSFCERWEWGVRALVAEGNGFAQGVGLSAGTYYETDQYVQGMFKVGANSLMGNPYASEDDITKMSWSELGQNNSFAHADYSEKSFEQAWDNSKHGWKDATRDVLTSQTFTGDIPSPLNMTHTTGMSEEQYKAMLDAAGIGPSAGERAETGQQGGGTR
ncbi:hypothetical protein ACH4UM_02585 [Streptomyces sp. NPDC020801]|uniref:hypothetical protein n=1 Tax=unclassified Streptomyces TaxID=2593676 RepID=UPI00379F7E07